MPRPTKQPRLGQTIGLVGEATYTAAAGDSKQPTFKINAYNGGPIHVGYFAPYASVIDLSGLTAHSARIPILLDHDPSAIIGQADKIDITSKRINVAGVFTGNVADPTDPAGKVAAHAANGFVWAASVGVRVDKYEFIDAKETAIVNGRRVTGPMYVVRQGALGEVSFVASGADGSASANIAATAAEGIHMDFNKWLKASGFDPESLSEEQTATLQLAYDAQHAPKPENKTNIVEAKSDGDSALKASREAAANEETRVAEIRKVCGVDFPEIAATCIRDGSTAERAELQVLKAREKAENDRKLGELRASRGNVNIIVPKAPTGPERLAAMEAAACRDLRLANREKHFKAEVLEAADRQYKRGTIGLQDMLIQAAEMGGMKDRVRRITDGSLRMVLGHAFNMQADAGFSTNDFGTALTAIANKFALEAYNSVNQSWRRISAIRPVNDFKTVTSYRLNQVGDYEQVGPGGFLKAGQLGTTAYTNQANTYGMTLGITRTDIINDDAGVLKSVPSLLGLTGARKLNSVFWTAWLADTTFFATADTNKNYISGSTTNLGQIGLTAGLKKFRDQVLEDGKTPTGFTPKFLLVPNGLEVEARNLFTSTYIIDSTASTRTGTQNVFNGLFEPVVSPYLTNATAWYLLADPMEAAAIEVAFLNGNETPVVEQADADFATLGINMRSYFDFGVTFQDFRAAIKSKGAA